MKHGTIRAWSFVHTWTSVICTAFLLMLCVTGLPLVFHHEIDHALDKTEWRPANPGGPLLDYDAMLAAALKDRPGDVPIFMSFDIDRPVVNVTSGVRADVPGSGMHFASYDQTSGALVPPPTGGGFMEFILQLHTDMFLGLPGMLFLGFMGLLFAASVVSGVVVYAPFMRKLPFGTVRASKSSRVKWLDYHNLLGIVATAWLLVVGITGVINTLAVPIIDYWKNTELAALTAPYKDKPPLERQTASLHQAIMSAQAAAPGMELQFVAFPGSSYSTNHHYAVFFHGRTPLTEHMISPALIDAETGELTAMSTMPWYAKALSLSQPLHFGDYGLLPLKILWALLDLATIVVLGSGLYLFVVRRRVNARAGAPAAIPAPAE